VTADLANVEDLTDAVDPFERAAPTTVAQELAALRRIVAALDALDPDSQHRAMRWLTDRYAER
jgi:hypothetical protein